MKKSIYASLLVLGLASLLACASTEEKPEAGGTTQGTVSSTLPGWTLFPALHEFGIQIDSSVAGEIHGQMEIGLSAKRSFELFAGLKNGATGKVVTDAVEIRRTQTGWTVILAFPESGDYELTLMGKPPSAALDQLSLLASASLHVKIDSASNVRLFPELTRLGLALVSCPGREVTNDADIVLDSQQPFQFAYSLTNTSTGTSIPPGAVEVSSDGSRWRIGISFPQSGDYTLVLYGKSGEEKDFPSLAEIRFHARVESPATLPHWRLASGFKRFGVAIQASPNYDVGNSAEILLTCQQSIYLSYDLRNASTGATQPGAVSVLSEGEGTRWRINISFPESGDWELALRGRGVGENDSTSLARARFKATVVLSANEKLVKALTSQDVALMRSALADGADPNVPISNIQELVRRLETPVVDAWPVFYVLTWRHGAEKQVEALRLLRTYGADFRSLTSTGDTLLSAFFTTSYSISRPSDECTPLLQALLDLGADPSQETPFYYISNGKPISTKIAVLLSMEQSGLAPSVLAAFVPLLIQHNANPHARWPWGRSALEELFQNYSESKTPLIRAYLEAGVDPTADELSAILFVVISKEFKGSFDFIAYLLSKTTHINDLDKSGWTLLHSLVRWETIDPVVLSRLLDALKAEGADFNLSNANGSTPLMLAVENLNTAAIDALLAHGVDPKRLSRTGQTVFHSIPWSKKMGEVAPLVDRFVRLGVDINACDSSGKSALYNACENENNLDYVKLLIRKGADPSLPDMDGLTALGNAKNHDCKVLVKYLVSLHVPETKGGWPVGNASAACRAVLEADLDAIRSIPNSQLEGKTARTADGVPATPLHLAAESGNLAVITALTAKKVDWNVGDRYGRTPLASAVLSGNQAVVTALLKAGADPNHRDDRGQSPFSLSIATSSSLMRTLLGSGVKPEWRTIAISTVVSAPLDMLGQLSPVAHWDEGDLDGCALMGRTDILEYLGDSVHHELKTKEALLADAKSSREVFEAYESQAKMPLFVPRSKNEWSDKKGSYTLTLQSWSPWMDVDPVLDLKKYPVAVFVPKEYDGSTPYGLMISMMNAKSSSQFPKPEYVATLEKHHLLYVGFDPYNGIFYDGSPDYFFTNHERLCLAAAYHMFGAYNVDRTRVYLTGFSWGGRLAGEIVPKQPRVFTGGLAVAGCFVSGERIIPSYRYARKNTVMILDTGDYDFNNEETFGGYSTFLLLGFEAHFFQEPRKGHHRISGENFEKAVSLLDAASRR